MFSDAFEFDEFRRIMKEFYHIFQDFGILYLRTIQHPFIVDLRTFGLKNHRTHEPSNLRTFGLTRWNQIFLVLLMRFDYFLRPMITNLLPHTLTSLLDQMATCVLRPIVTYMYPLRRIITYLLRPMSHLCNVQLTHIC